MDISYSGLIELHDSIGNLKELKVIKMEACQVHELLRSVGKMKKLKGVDAHGSSLKGEIPTEIGGLSSLQRLVLSQTQISMLPWTMSQLSSLEILCLRQCDELEELPMLPTSLVSLKFTSKRFKRVPDLSLLTNLADLVLNRVDARPIAGEILSMLRAWSNKEAGLVSDKKRLEFKKSLQFNMSNVNTVPAEILGFFPQLESLELGCLELLSLPQFPLSLSRLVLKYLNINTKPTCLSNLKNLSNLTLFEFSIGEDGFKSLGTWKLKHLKILWIEEDCSGLNGLSLPRSLWCTTFLACTPMSYRIFLT